MIDPRQQPYQQQMQQAQQQAQIPQGGTSGYQMMPPQQVDPYLAARQAQMIALPQGFPGGVRGGFAPPPPGGGIVGPVPMPQQPQQIPMGVPPMRPDLPFGGRPMQIPPPPMRPIPVQGPVARPRPMPPPIPAQPSPAPVSPGAPAPQQAQAQRVKEKLPAGQASPTPPPYMQQAQRTRRY